MKVKSLIQNINKQENKEKLMIIKEMSPESKISMRNVELVRKMSEKVKKGREEKMKKEKKIDENI